MDRRPPAYQLRILASAVSNNLFLPPQKWTLQRDKHLAVHALKD